MPVVEETAAEKRRARFEYVRYLDKEDLVGGQRTQPLEQGLEGNLGVAVSGCRVETVSGGEGALSSVNAQAKIGVVLQSSANCVLRLTSYTYHSLDNLVGGFPFIVLG